MLKTFCAVDAININDVTTILTVFINGRQIYNFLH